MINQFKNQRKCSILSSQIFDIQSICFANLCLLNIRGDLRWQQVIGEKYWSSFQENLQKEPNGLSTTSQKKGIQELQEKNARDVEDLARILEVME